MKNKKNIIILIEGIIIAILAIVLIIICVGKKAHNNEPENNEQNIVFKEVEKDIPDFSIQLTGNYKGYITKDYVQAKNIKLYEFDATINNGWNRNTDRYIGYKLNDLLNAFDITDYNSIEFHSNDGVRISFGRYLLTDNFFIVFYQNGELIEEATPAMMINTDYRSNYSVARLIRMEMGIPTNLNNEDNGQTDENNTDDQSDKTDQQQ